MEIVIQIEIEIEIYIETDIEIGNRFKDTIQRDEDIEIYLDINRDRYQCRSR